MESATIERRPVGDPLRAIRELEAQRLAAMRANDPEMLDALLAANMIYIHESGQLYHRDKYIRAIASRDLLYRDDINLEEEEIQPLDNAVIVIGIMRGHGFLDGEQQVFHVRYLALWICIEESWRLAVIQKTPVISAPIPPSV